VFKAGLHSDEMEDLAKAGEEGRAIKCSTRDLPLVASNHYRQMQHTNLMKSGVSGETRWGGTLGRIFSFYLTLTLTLK